MTFASLTPSHPTSALSSSRRRGPGRAQRRQRPRITLPAIRAAIDWQPRYCPRDVAEFCGVSEDRVTDSILARPEMFPERQRYARRHDWTEDEFAKVIASICALCPKARTYVLSKLSELSEI